MNRRAALKKSGILLGAGLTISNASLLQSCLDDKSVNQWQPFFLTRDHVALINDFINILIPDDEVPEKVKLTIPKYIDVVLNTYSSKEIQEDFKKGIDEFNESCKKHYGKDFVSCNDTDKISFLKEREKQFVHKDSPNFYGTLKQLVFEAFFQTEYGITRFLQFNPIPGGYEGCIPFGDMGRIQHSNDIFKL